VRSPDRAGQYCLRATFLQDQVAWFDSPECHQFKDIEIVVI